MASIPLVLTERWVADSLDDLPPAAAVLSLTAEERTKSRHRFTKNNLDVCLQLPRGTVLQHGDLLGSGDGAVVQIVAGAEPVMTVSGTPLALMRAAYHLGNRHVPVQVSERFLRLAPDPVLRAMLLAQGLTVTDSLEPFQPESGAYGSHSHG
ncbi:MAG: urease accessory protein UreE [Cyanobacteria bacterium P01_A01_bin.135]